MPAGGGGRAWGGVGIWQPRPQGFSLKKWVGQEKALASAGQVSPRTPKNPGCNKLALCEKLKLCVTSQRAILGGLLYLLTINEKFYKISFLSQILAMVFFCFSPDFYDGDNEYHLQNFCL